MFQNNINVHYSLDKISHFAFVKCVIQGQDANFQFSITKVQISWGQILSKQTFFSRWSFNTVGKV